MSTPLQRRRPGRPPLKEGESSVTLSCRMPASTFDALDKLASTRRVSMPEVMRSAVAKLLRDPDDDEQH